MSMKLIITTAALVAALAGPAVAGGYANGTRTRAIQDLQRTTARASVERAFEADAYHDGQRPAPPAIAAQSALPQCGFAAIESWGPNGFQYCDSRNVRNSNAGPLR
jgi:hypothetical protein